jgi:lipopolysaccharide cholinephosphotransferase
MLTELERQQLRSVLIELLDYVVEVCNRNELDYILVGGTLLGAIRHNGFIPWDDDIDVSLPRKHYEKLIMELKKSYNEKYFLHD